MHKTGIFRPFAGLLVALAASFVSMAGHAAETTDARIAAHLDDLRTELDPRAAQALDRIPGLDRRLLAARAYLRAGPSLGERWSWSQAQIAAYEGSPLQRALDAEVAKVRATFEAENPGHTLWVNPQVRSVEVQLERWNDNATVGLAASSMLGQVRTALAAPGAPSPGTPNARAWFEQVVRDASPEPASPLAAPGLSRHGRMQAVDFQVHRGDEIVAGPNQAEIATVWDAQGWCERLVRAVRTSSDRFEGPLLAPNEPWHYEYVGPTNLAARAGD